MHIYKHSRLLARWNLEDWQPLSGAINSHIEKILHELIAEGKFDEILKNKKG